MTENGLISSLYSEIERISGVKFFPYYLAMLLTICSITIQTPNFSDFNSKSQAWEVIELKSNHPTNPLTHLPPESWLAKKVFRLTAPIIMRTTHLNPSGMVILQYIFNYSLIVLCYKMTYKILKDPVSSTLICSGIAFIYFGRAGFYDLRFMYFDCISFLFLILAMYNNDKILIFVFCFAAAWNDERAFIALSLVWLFHKLNKTSNSRIHIKNIINLDGNSFAVFFAIFAYALMRFYLSFKYSMHTPSVGANLMVLKKTLPCATIGIWTSLEGFWLLFLFAIAQAFKDKNYVFLGLILIPSLIIGLVANCVTDITRSGSFLVPVIFVLLIYLRNVLTEREMRRLLLPCFAISLLYPAIIVSADWYK